jgi:nitrogenase molybdenum-iron protein beta chain
VPSLRFPGLPIGATDTTKFVRQVAEALNLDAALVESVIAKEEDYVYSYLAQSIGVVSWKRFAVVADANNAVGLTRYLANDFSFTPVLVIVSEPIFREADKQRILDQINDMEYARPPKVVFTADQYEINTTIENEEEEITLLLGSTNEKEVALRKDIQFINAAFPMNERLIFNRTYAGYRGSLTFTEDLYDNL